MSKKRNQELGIPEADEAAEAVGTAATDSDSDLVSILFIYISAEKFFKLARMAGLGSEPGTFFFVYFLISLLYR
jgi:hypothetical protein